MAAAAQHRSCHMHSDTPSAAARTGTRCAGLNSTLYYVMDIGQCPKRQIKNLPIFNRTGFQTESPNCLHANISAFTVVAAASIRIKLRLTSYWSHFTHPTACTALIYTLTHNISCLTQQCSGGGHSFRGCKLAEVQGPPLCPPPGIWLDSCEGEELLKAEPLPGPRRSQH